MGHLNHEKFPMTYRLLNYRTSRTSLASNASASGPWFAKVVSQHPSKSALAVPVGGVMTLSNGSLTCQPCLTRGLTNAKTNPALRPRSTNQDAKHTAHAGTIVFDLVSALLRCTTRSAEPIHDQLPYTASSRKHPARQHEHSEPMASIGNRTSVLQAARTRSIHAERCLPVHAGQRRQHDSSGAWPSGSPNSLRAERREISSLLAELNHRVEVTPGLSPLFFACKWLRLPPYACSSRAPRLLRGWAIHAPQIDLPTALASWASSAVSMTRREASWRQQLPAPSQGGVRLVALRPLRRSIQTLICGGADHD